MFKIGQKSILRGLIIGLGIIAVLIAFGIIASKVASQDSVKIEYAAGANLADQNVFDALLNLSKKENFEVKYNTNSKYGVFIESIHGVKNGDDGKYWQYYVNGTLGDVAADKKELKAGDKVEWRFEKVPEF